MTAVPEIAMAVAVAAMGLVRRGPVAASEI